MIRTQLQAVSTTTGAGEVLLQLPINIVIRHMANSLLYIVCLLGYFRFPFCHSNTGGGVLFGTLVISFGFCLTDPTSMADAERTSDSTQDDND
ncbi:Uncharacterised protein [Klebsiella quasipneumoniae]|nr:Uncharacterised protein [Klebsiella pneumoniae]SVO31815.1 Uncharacterised protein [Klebsiella pneumoniae]VGF58967.1 Uncharacterised protein [Klebsiella pneumoniae]VGJ37985.1 Uncharacterised protein [Klebsiella quasipneumoniae]